MKNRIAHSSRQESAKSQHFWWANGSRPPFLSKYFFGQIVSDQPVLFCNYQLDWKINSESSIYTYTIECYQIAQIIGVI